MQTDAKLYQDIAGLLADAGMIGKGEYHLFADQYTITDIEADGSTRNFFRVQRGSDKLCVGVTVADNSRESLAEAQAAIAIGTHLYNKKVPVAKIIAANKGTGLILFEDLGDTRLHDYLQKLKGDRTRLCRKRLGLYRQLIVVLAHMQVNGRVGFEQNWCHDTVSYDKRLMIERESYYFLNEFWYGLLDGQRCDDIDAEFNDMAVQAAQGEAGFFLHRDFQSRNIMIAGTGLKIIDFQGGRLGPPGYDLASLLIDPYVGLEEEEQQELLQYYLGCLHRLIDYDVKAFLRQYTYLRLQRNLQILGAFSFLHKKRGKPFFEKYIVPALHSLVFLLNCEELRKYTQLRTISHKAMQRIENAL